MKPIYTIFLSFSFLLSTACQDKPGARSKASTVLNDAKKRELTLLLEDIYDKDQQPRQSVSSTIAKYGLKSSQIKELALKMKAVDSSNVLIVKSIIAKYGWLSSSTVGTKGNSALFLVIQHASEYDRKHFLPIMRNAVQHNAASKQDLALLEDRVTIDQGKKQLYGTQIGFDEKTKKYYVLPIENPEEVDKRRGKLGMVPIAAYLSQWGIEWED